MPFSSGDSYLGAEPQTRYLKRVLIPFWVIRCAAMILMLVGDIAAIAIIKENDSDNDFFHRALG
jgi:hypothetical protein